MTITLAQIAIRNGQLLVPPTKIVVDDGQIGEALMGRRDVLTVVANLASAGYAMDRDALRAVLSLREDEVDGWWGATREALAAEDFSDRGMDRFVVYKNFPAEVLSKSEAEYWVPQVLMYLGAPPALFAEQEEPRAPADDKRPLRVLKGKGPARLVAETFAALREKGKSWTDPEAESATFLLRHAAEKGGLILDVSDFRFRGNGVLLAKTVLTDPALSATTDLRARDATDALRLAQALAPGRKRPRKGPVYAWQDPAERKQKRAPRPDSVLGTLPRPHRRAIAGMLAESANLESDAARRPREFRALLRALRPGDLGHERLSGLYDALYNGRVKGAQAAVENTVKAGSADALREAEALPAGLRLRRFRKLYEADPAGAVNLAIRALPDVDTGAVLGFSAQVRTVNGLPARVAVPKGDWRKVQILPNDGARIAPEHQDAIAEAARDLIGSRLAAEFPKGVRRLEDFDRLGEVKVPENGQALAPYGRGTTFPIPEEDGFVRTASYWKDKGRSGNTWFDNGLTFLDEGMTVASAVCWNSPGLGPDGPAIFSGDPVNSQEKDGRACQMIDLYPEKRGEWRYALWNVLGFSHIKFSEVNGEVLATMQTGTDPQKGKLYDPARARFAFRLERPVLTSYVALVDMEERVLTYLDLDLGGSVQSACANTEMVKVKLPAILAVLKARPSWRDLMECAPESPDGTPVGYADHGVSAERALTFSQEDEAARYEQVRITDLLSGKGGGYTRDHEISPDSPSLR